MAVKRSFDEPDTRIEIGGVTHDEVEIGDYTVSRTVCQPGWRWSKDMKPIIGGDWCMVRHVGVILSGRQGVLFPDGTVVETGAGDVYDIPPGHDGYVIGDEPLVALDWSQLEAWAGVDTGQRVLAGLLMTDLVGSTEEAARVGDVEWKRRLAEHHASVRVLLDRFRGREVDTAGDGVFAIFDGAARALYCAAAIRHVTEQQGARIRAAVHAGEVELHGPEVRGIAVHEVARIAAVAQPDEILASEATRALAAGAGLAFEDRGEHELKGIDGARRLYAYVGSDTP